MENIEKNLESLGNKHTTSKVENEWDSKAKQLTKTSQVVNQYKQTSTNNESYSQHVMSRQEHDTSHTNIEHLPKAKNVKQIWEEKVHAENTGSKSNAQELYNRQDNLSFPEIAEAEHPPALPPKKKIMFSPSRNIFSPTESVESYGIRSTSALKTDETVVAMGVKEKAQLIASQHKEYTRKESEATTSNENVKSRGVRLLPASPITVRQSPITVRQSPAIMRQMSVESKTVESELHEYDTVVTRTPPITPMVMDKTYAQESPLIFENAQTNKNNEGNNLKMDSSTSKSSSNYQTISETTQTFHSTSQQQFSSSSYHCTEEKQEQLEKSENKYNLDQDIDQLIAETESLLSEDSFLNTNMMQSTTMMQEMKSVAMSMDSFNSSMGNNQKVESPAEKCRRSFEEAELEAAMTHESLSSKTSSVVESFSVQSTNEQQISSVQENHNEVKTNYQERNSSQTSTQQVSVPGWATPVMSGTIEDSQKTIAEPNDDLAPRGRSTTRPSLSTRTPESFIRRPPQTPINSTPNTPSATRRLRINQSPKPPDSDVRPKYRDTPSSPFQPGFYRPPPDDPNSGNMFQLLRRNSSKSRMPQPRAEEVKTSQQNVRGSGVSQVSSKAYEGDNESCSEDGHAI
jgi:hypothetical protein